MAKYVYGLALMLGVSLGLSVLARAEQPENDKKVAALIEKLGSGDFEDRENATEELDKLGLAALEALKKASQSADAEVRRRAEELVVKIEKREASTLILKPTRVTLSLKDVPVQQAVDALAKQTGFPIRLQDPEGKLNSTRVTLEVKDAPFWDVLNTLSAQANLVETQTAEGPPLPPGFQPPVRVRPPIRIRPPIRAVPLPGNVVPLPAVDPNTPVPAPAVPPRPEGFAFAQVEAVPAAPQPVPPVQVRQIQIQGNVQIQGKVQIGGGQIIIGGGGMPFPGGMAQPQDGIVLVPGKNEPVATDLGTSFRIRRAPNQFQIQVPGKNVDMITLEVTPEPRFRMVGQDKVEVTRAIDDQDQKLTTIDPNQPQNLPGGGVGVGIAFPAGGPGFPGMPGAGGLMVPLHFVRGEKAAKSLKELEGTISARIEVPHSKPIVVEKLLDSTGKNFKGEKGGEIRIQSVKKTNDLVAIRFELVQARDAVGAPNGAGGINFPGGGIQIIPGVAPAILPIAPPVPVPAPVPPQGRRQIEKPGFAFQVEDKPVIAPAPAPVAPPPAPPVPVVQPLPAIAVAPIQIGGGAIGIGGGTLPAGLRILDEKGNPVPVAGVQQQWQVGPNGPAQVTWEIQIPQGKDQPKIEKMTWQQYRSATVDIPFKLKNVPLN
jgi:hypothetical protein